MSVAKHHGNNNVITRLSKSKYISLENPYLQFQIQHHPTKPENAYQSEIHYESETTHKTRHIVVLILFLV